jgi:hypothetical protein
MPLHVKMPKNAQILSIKYHDGFDHIYFTGNPHAETEIRKFVYGKTSQYFEEINGIEYVFVASSQDEHGEVWHYFELVPTVSSSVIPQRSRKR